MVRTYIIGACVYFICLGAFSQKGKMPGQSSLLSKKQGHDITTPQVTLQSKTPKGNEVPYSKQISKNPKNPWSAKSSSSADPNVIWEETFENGIPESWTITDHANYGAWKYSKTGPQGNTTLDILGDPNTEQGVRDVYSPLKSPTGDDGFIIMDADSFQNDADLVSETGGYFLFDTDIVSSLIDVSDHDTLFLQFYHSYSFFAVEDFSVKDLLPDRLELNVGISTDGTNYQEWNVLDSSRDASHFRNFASVDEPNPMLVKINISEFIKGEDSLYIRFHWKTGTGMFWMVDDVALTTPAKHEMGITGTFSYYNNPDPSVSTNGQLYSFMPLNQAKNGLLNGGVILENFGLERQRNVKVTAKLMEFDSDCEIYTETQTIDSMDFGESNVVSFVFKPAVPFGRAYVTYTVESDSIANPEADVANKDSYLTDNSSYYNISYTFVTADIYANFNNFNPAAFLTAPDIGSPSWFIPVYNCSYTLVQGFDIRQDVTIDGVWALIGAIDPTASSSFISGVAMELDNTGLSQVATSGPIEVTAEDVWVYLEFLTPLDVKASDEVIYLGVESFDGSALLGVSANDYGTISFESGRTAFYRDDCADPNWVGYFDWAVGVFAEMDICSDQPDYSSTTTSPACGADDGELIVNATGNFDLMWIEGESCSSAKTLSQIPAGEYVAAVSDQNGCVDTLNFFVQTESDIATEGSLTHNVCAEDNEGSITLTTTGGTPPYNYDWDNGSHHKDLGGLTAGSYTVEITDSSDCVTFQTFEVTDLNAPIVIDTVLTPDDGTDNGTATALVTGGTPPYTYQWLPGTGLTDQIATGLSSGIPYVALVEDSNGCSKSLTNIMIPEGVNGISEHNLRKHFLVYPNPNKGAFNIQFQQPFSGNIEIKNLLGEQVYSTRVEIGTAANTAIDLNTVPNGIYYLTLSGKQIEATYKLIRER